MACFVAPAATAAVTTILGKKLPTHLHIEWLNTMLWGGSMMLAVEHIAHGEVVLYPPFFTAIQNPANISVMIQEILTVGVSMTIAIVLAWSLLLYTKNILDKTKYAKLYLQEK